MKTTTQELIKKAKLNNANAQLELTDRYIKGSGVKKNYNIAIRWLKKSAELGCIEAQFQLGNYYRAGKYLTKNYKKAILWYKKAASNMHIEAICQLIKCYHNGIGVYENTNKAITLEQQLANKGITYWQVKIAQRYYSGEGVKQNKVRAYSHFKQLADKSFVAKLYLANCYYYGWGTKQQLSLACSIWNECENQINKLCTNNWQNREKMNHYKKAFNNRYYLGGDEKFVNYGLTLKHCHSLVIDGNAFGTFQIGVMLYNGYGLTRNTGLGESYLIKAAKNGIQLTQELLLNIYSQNNHEFASADKISKPNFSYTTANYKLKQAV